MLLSPKCKIAWQSVRRETPCTVRPEEQKDTIKLEVVVWKCFANTPTKYLNVLSRNFRHYAPDNFCNVVLRARARARVCVCVCVQSRYASPSKYIHSHGVESGKGAGHKGHALLKTATELRLHLNCRRCDTPIVRFWICCTRQGEEHDSWRTNSTQYPNDS
jgi:hypothetical protein